ncbi:TetR/AcrR family transcriptional regulator [Trujillonella endophytica]|uniref:Transcriptional regulator, TetR family n=1 Tax=Trujillonella endophytica TaxID=673521 RepID=A0A1H8W7T8_9ACTN|nr:TetR family transcriptional regulator [Trujillella endophytica]SEP23712.1 transcriptional regulator, TetR family [Trujillella endophytica]
MSSTPAPQPPPRKRRARGSISAAEILQGAYQLADEESLEALSMPRLAQRLDVGVTSIYWYFRSKDELLDTLAERAMAEFDRQLDIPDDLAWDDYLRAYFRHHRRLFRENELLCDLIVLRSPGTPEASRLAAERIDRVLQVLVAAGFPPDGAMNAYAALSVFTRGSAALARLADDDDAGSDVAPGPFDEAPRLRVLSQLDRPRPLAMTGDEEFEFGLENTLRGLRAYLRELRGDEPCVSAVRESPLTDGAPTAR